MMAEQLKSANSKKGQEVRKDKKPLVQTSISQEVHSILSQGFSQRRVLHEEGRGGKEAQTSNHDEHQVDASVTRSTCIFVSGFNRDGVILGAS
jgi:hypothetical protein